MELKRAAVPIPSIVPAVDDPAKIFENPTKLIFKTEYVVNPTKLPRLSTAKPLDANDASELTTEEELNEPLQADPPLADELELDLSKVLRMY